MLELGKKVRDNLWAVCPEACLILTRAIERAEQNPEDVMAGVRLMDAIKNTVHY